jgi:hypothetical protein
VQSCAVTKACGSSFEHTHPKKKGKKEKEKPYKPLEDG